MYINPHKWIMFIGDALLIIFTTYLSQIIRLGHSISTFQFNIGASVVTIVLYLSFFYIFDLYNLSRRYRSNETLMRIILAVLFAFVGSAMLFYSFPNWKYDRGIFLIQAPLVIVFVLMWRILSEFLRKHSNVKENILIIGAGDSGKFLFQFIQNLKLPYHVVGFLDDDPAKQNQIIGPISVIATTDKLRTVAQRHNVKTAILAIRHNRHIEPLRSIRSINLQGLNIIDMPEFFESQAFRIPVHHIQDEWLFFADGFNLLSKEYIKKIKRLIDVSVSMSFLLISSPIMILTAVAIVLESKGPVFYKQIRVGLDGKEFSIFKFRSMCENAECMGAVWASDNDPRVTRVGKWIRLFRIDELPQLFNVLKGDMSLIGPRPERPEFVEQLLTVIPFYYARHKTKPGITGWAQVNYRYGASVEDAKMKLEYDLYYIKNMSFILDFQIFLKTIGVVFFAQGSR